MIASRYKGFMKVQRVSKTYFQSQKQQTQPSKHSFLHSSRKESIFTSRTHDTAPSIIKMKTTQLTILFACIAAAVATPVAASEPEYIEHYREDAKWSNGSLIWYGPSSGSKHNTTSESESTLSARAKASCSVAGDAPTCGTSHAARNQECDLLVTELNGDGAVGVPNSPRQICYQGDASKDEYCCVSWANAVPGLVKADLATPAYKIEQTCTANGITGKISNIWLEQTCTTVCLSNRGTGCS